VVETVPVQAAQASPPQAQPQPQTQAQAQPPKLPQTASALPLVGLVGTLVLLAGVGLLMIRSRAH
jgi:LPXTG-motif cell wall-anchored protein